MKTVTDPLRAINLRHTPQNEPADPSQRKNNAGGYVFAIDQLAQLRRWLSLGSVGGTYYTTEKALTKDNAQVVIDYARTNATELVAEVVAISVAGRAPRNNPALFALAAAASLGDEPGRKAALDALDRVARTGTHLFIFAGYVEQFRGWGRGLRRAVGQWYLDKDVQSVAYQAVKYRNREGWSHRDMLRLSHPKADSPEQKVLFDWICRPEGEMATQLDAAMSSPLMRAGWSKLDLVTGFRAAQKATTADGWVGLINDFRLPWEALPDAALNEPKVWRALIDNGMPQTALMRQLPRLTRLGVLGQMSPYTAKVAGQLSDPEKLKKARVHPINVLVALRTYASGESARGSSSWTPSAAIIDALDAAFYNAFSAVEPMNKRTLLALDVSGSMGSPVSGLPLTCREATAALALVTASTEPSPVGIVGFTGSGSYDRTRDGLSALAISPRQRLDDAIRAVSNLPFGRTDCALPMLVAAQEKWEIDTVVVLTDNETWHGNVHPYQALRTYREKMGIDTKLVVVSMTATEFSIADPSDPGMLDVSGLDSSVPTLISDFARS